MITGKKQSRKQFLKQVGWIILLPYLMFGWLMIRRHQQVSSSRIISLKIPDEDGVFFHDEVIMVKHGVSIKVLSSRCTHLGCRINKLEGGKLVCPCHGSSFSEDGDVITGPAIKNLNRLQYTIDPGKQEITIKI